MQRLIRTAFPALFVQGQPIGKIAAREQCVRLVPLSIIKLGIYGNSLVIHGHRRVELTKFMQGVAQVVEGLRKIWHDVDGPLIRIRRELKLLQLLQRVAAIIQNERVVWRQCNGIVKSLKRRLVLIHSRK